MMLYGRSASSQSAEQVTDPSCFTHRWREGRAVSQQLQAEMSEYGLVSMLLGE